MSDAPDSPQAMTPPLDAPARSIWMRALLMVLLALAFQLASTLLCAVALVQLVVVLLKQDANARLAAFARSLGSYLRQIAEFVGFASEALPFPFSDWPAA